MDNIWLTARSLTEAQKMRFLLERHRIPAAVQRARGAAAAKGCGYMVGVKKGAMEQVKMILRSGGIFPRKVFSEEAGRWQEVRYDLF